MKKLFLISILFFISLNSLASCPDGSEPTRTVSADGTYFIFECNAEKKETLKSSYEEIKENETLKSSYEEIEEIVESTTPKDNCSNTKNAIVTTREFLSQTKSFIQLKNYVIDVSLQQAFQQVNGSEIRNFDSLSMIDINGDEDVNFNSSSSTKYAGLIDSYEIIDEEITDQFLILTVDANVCIKDKNSVSKDVLLVGDFTYQNSAFPVLKSTAESIFSKESKSFELGYGSPSNSYHDILITGRIDNVTSERVVNEATNQAAEKRTDKQAETAAFFAIIGALKQSQNEGEDVFENIMETVGGIKKAEMEGSASAYSIIKIYVSVSANHKTDNRTYTATAETEKKVSSSSYDLESLAIDAFVKASKDLYLKLNNRSNN
tara:strand:+ start:2214 stop:3344 length:1131 start_codon:yes stop_codon:yes gene_type:complete